jgi:hypothetical protein
MLNHAQEGMVGGITKCTRHPVISPTSHVPQLPPARLKPGCSFDQQCLLQAHLSISCDLIVSIISEHACLLPIMGELNLTLSFISSINILLANERISEYCISSYLVRSTIFSTSNLHSTTKFCQKSTSTKFVNKMLMLVKSTIYDVKQVISTI